jgi:hypothetical protein
MTRRAPSAPRRGRIALALAGLAVAALALGCDPLQPLQVLSEDQKLLSITLAPDSTNLSMSGGDTLRLGVTLHGKGSGTISGPVPAWTVGNPLIISVDATGLIHGLQVGRSEVLATLNGHRGVAVVIVTP